MLEHRAVVNHGAVVGEERAVLHLAHLLRTDVVREHGLDRRRRIRPGHHPLDQRIDVPDRDGTGHRLVAGEAVAEAHGPQPTVVVPERRASRLLCFVKD